MKITVTKNGYSTSFMSRPELAQEYVEAALRGGWGIELELVSE